MWRKEKIYMYMCVLTYGAKKEKRKKREEKRREKSKAREEGYNVG
jgi:hypothetical protein